MIDLKQVSEWAIRLSVRAGKFLLSEQNKAIVLSHKDKVDIATSADYGVEKMVVTAIRRRFPEHSIFSEEKGFIHRSLKYTWYLDPLDGTKEYVRHIPEYNCSFCLFYHYEPILAVVNLPYVNYIFSAVKDHGAYLNGQRIKVNHNRILRQSIIYTQPPCFGKLPLAKFRSNFNRLANVTANVYRLRYTSNENTYLPFLALGSIDAYFNVTYPSKSIQDIAPGLFIAQEAGAKITTIKGEKYRFKQAHQLYLASNGHIHQELLGLINQSV